MAALSFPPFPVTTSYTTAPRWPANLKFFLKPHLFPFIRVAFVISIPSQTPGICHEIKIVVPDVPATLRVVTLGIFQTAVTLLRLGPRRPLYGLTRTEAIGPELLYASGLLGKVNNTRFQTRPRLKGTGRATPLFSRGNIHAPGGWNCGRVSKWLGRRDWGALETRPSLARMQRAQVSNLGQFLKLVYVYM